MKLSFILLLFFSFNSYSSSISQMLIDNSEDITNIKGHCGSELGREIKVYPINYNVLQYNFTLQQSFLGFVEKQCLVIVESDISDLSYDGVVKYKFSYKEK